MEGPKKRWAASGDGRSQRTKGGSAPNETESGGDRVILSRKELARELRREAYQRAKRARAADPRQQALKERAKQRRRELYQQVKARRKACAAELEAAQKTRPAKARTGAEPLLGARRDRLTRVNGALAKTEASSIGRNRIDDATIDDATIDDERIDAALVGGARLAGARPDDAPADFDQADPARGLALDIERALQSGEVRELMARLERESATLAAQHRAIHHEDDDEP